MVLALLGNKEEEENEQNLTNQLRRPHVHVWIQIRTNLGLHEGGMKSLAMS